MRSRAVLFDLDDTLYDEASFVYGAMKEVAAFLHGRISKPATHIHNRLMQELEAAGRGQVFDVVLKEFCLPVSLVPTLVYVYRSARPPLALFADASSLLQRLRDSGFRLGIVTDGTALVQGAKVDLLGLRQSVDVVVLTDAVDGGRPKPSPAGFRIACDLLDVPPAAVAYVGNDLRKDFVGPRALQMRGILVKHRQIGTLAGIPDGARPDDIVATLRDLWPILECELLEGTT